ncbi:ATP-binding protein [Nocardiopsis sp. HNM0947]|uniref:ATP-binding protein n=1 Tax=Nocardiopsis coralli TaxID=2772213 RepID=A0ABR9PD54_9ACTN|nr:ATP-binding protein [Nocardiopsis coralli]MBE3001781.1 ATP-binding protein [Nocardiopsis coralli]
MNLIQQTDPTPTTAPGPNSPTGPTGPISPAATTAPTVWEPRTYPGHLCHLRDVRTHLTHDLNGFDTDLVETIVLCASELFANCVKYTDSGRPNGEVIRFLNWQNDRIRLGFTDQGGSGALPRIPDQRSDDDWAWAEGQRGLLMVQTLSTAWGHLPTAPWADLGTHVWADLAVPPRTPTPHHLASYVFTELHVAG